MDKTLPEEPRGQSQRLHWGIGRVAMYANLETIKDRLGQGYPKTLIYNELKDRLGGLSYSQFVAHVRKMSADSGSIPKNFSQKIDEPETTINKGFNLDERGKHEKRKTSAGKPSKFTPGPRIPDPSQLY